MVHRIGVCSWSLAPESPDDLVTQVRATGVRHLQLALDPIRLGEWSIDELIESVDAAGISLCSGMMAMEAEDYSTLESIQRTGGVRPDATWAANLDAAAVDAALARTLGLDLVTFHAGFMPHDACTERSTMIGRLRELVDIYVGEGVRVGFETGQESADTMKAVLEELDRPRGAGINFDPANMILYAMGDPVAALSTLADDVFQIHIKDARRTSVAGTWGTEVPAGDGEVDWPAFFDVVASRKLDVDFVIEREAGASRVADITRARELVESLMAERGFAAGEG